MHVLGNPLMTPLRDLRKKFAEDYRYQPKPKAMRKRIKAVGMVEGETIKKKGDLVIESAHMKARIV